MEVTILKKEERPIVSRTVVEAEVSFPGKTTPSRLSICENIAKKLKHKPELTVVRHIYTEYGDSKAVAIAHLYQDEKSMKTLESDKLLKKHEKKEEPKETKEAEAPKEEPKAEEKKEEAKDAPKEEKKEEPAEESKTESKEENKEN